MILFLSRVVFIAVLLCSSGLVAADSGEGGVDGICRKIYNGTALTIDIDTFVAGGGDVNAHDCYGMSMLTSSLYPKRYSLVQYDIVSCLLKHGSDIRDDDWRLVIKKATSTGCPQQELFSSILDLLLTRTSLLPDMLEYAVSTKSSAVVAKIIGTDVRVAERHLCASLDCRNQEIFNLLLTKYSGMPEYDYSVFQAAAKWKDIPEAIVTDLLRVGFNLIGRGDAKFVAIDRAVINKNYSFLRLVHGRAEANGYVFSPDCLSHLE